jgi:hypothetical protein
MNRINLFASLHGDTTLEGFAGKLASSLGMPELHARESSNYLEGRYFQGEHQGLLIEVSLRDHVSDALRYRIHIKSAAPDAGERVEDIVRQQLIPAGFACMRVMNFGREDEQLQQY